MKDLGLLTWLTQLGISVAVPLAGFVLLAVWLRDRFGWGAWVIWAGIVLGGYCAFQGLRSSLRTMERYLGKDKKDTPQKISFNDHE
ncbi:MAG: AtpZ/AtpI family protein [Faecousia sp.]